MINQRHCYFFFILENSHNPPAIIITKIIIPTNKGANTSKTNPIIATMIIKAIIATIIIPIVPNTNDLNSNTFDIKIGYGDSANSSSHLF